MTNTEIIDRVRENLAANKPQEALTLLNSHFSGDEIEILFLKGEIYYKLQKWGDSLNHFNLFLEYFPKDKKAQAYCVMIHNILGFHHKDLLNP